MSFNAKFEHGSYHACQKSATVRSRILARARWWRLGWSSMSDSRLVIAGRTFGSRLLLGTGKFSSSAAMSAALEASGTEIVTVEHP